MDPLVIVLLSSLAAARVWRALMTDDIGWRWRNFVWRWTPLREFAQCPWCFGFWICWGFVALGVFAPATVFLLVAGPFAANYISANLNVHTGDKHD